MGTQGERGGDGKEDRLSAYRSPPSPITHRAPFGHASHVPRPLCSIPASMYSVGKQQKSLLSSHFRFLLANGNDGTNNITWESTAQCFYLVKSYLAISSTDSKVGLYTL